MSDEDLKENLIDCVLNNEDSENLMNGIYRIFERAELVEELQVKNQEIVDLNDVTPFENEALRNENKCLQSAIDTKNMSIDILGEQKLYRDEEIKRLKKALTVAYAHSLDAEMDETSDMLLHVLYGGKVDRHWNEDLEKGKKALEVHNESLR